MPSNPEPAPSDYSKAVAAEIRRLLADRRLRAADVVRNTTMSANYLSVRLREERSFTLTDIETLGDYLGFDPATFLSRVARPYDEQDELARRRRVGGSTETSDIDEPLAAGSRGDVADPEDTDA